VAQPGYCLSANTSRPISKAVIRLSAVLLVIVLMSSGALPFIAPVVQPVGAESLQSWTKIFHMHDNGEYADNVYDWMNASDPANPADPDYDADGLDGITIKKNVPPQRVHHWVLYPSLDTDTILSGDMTAHVWARSRGNESATLMTAIFYDMAPGDFLNPAVWVEIGRNTIPLAGDVYSDFKPYDITVPAVNYTLVGNHSLVLTMCRGDSLNDWLIVMFDQTAKDSFVNLRTQTFVSASSAWTEDSSGSARPVFTDLENAVVWVNVSDTFGAYEILGANLSLAYAGNGTIRTPVIVMSLSATDPSSPSYWKLFSAQLPLLPPDSYLVNVTVRDAQGSPSWTTVSFTVIGVDHFEVSIPSDIVSGQPFSMSVKAMNETNAVLTNWVGTVQLTPFKPDMVLLADGTLSVLSVTLGISDFGQVNITDQSYSGGEDELILVRASCPPYLGWSGTAVAHSGPLVDIWISPAGGDFQAGQTEIFSAVGRDANNNTNNSWTPSWSLTAPVGTLTVNGYSVTFLATSSGTGSLVCRDIVSGINASAAIDVAVGDLDHITITTPAQGFTIREGDIQTLAAIGHDSSGNVVSIDDAKWYTTTSGQVLGEGNFANYTAGMIPESGVIQVVYLGVTGEINVTIIEGLHGPTLTLIEPQAYSEDVGLWTLNLGAYWHDIDGTGDLRWVVEGVNTTLYFVSHDPSSFEKVLFYTQPNQNGNDTFVLWVYDSLGYRTFRTVTVVITAMPDPPVFYHNPPTQLYVKFDTPYTFDFTYYVQDVDTAMEDLVMSASIDGKTTTKVLFDHLNGNYLFPTKPEGNYFEVIVLGVSDGTGSDILNTVVWVTDDTPPSLNSTLPDWTVQERCVNEPAWDLDQYFYDLDQDLLYYFSGFDHISVVPNETTHIVYISAPEEWSGTSEGTLTARDPTGALKVVTVRIIVTPYNNKPEVKDIGEVHVRFNETYVLYLQLYVSDSDNSLDTLNITVNNLHVNHTSPYGVHRLELLFPPNKNDTIPIYEGPYTVTVRLTVSDGNSTNSTEFTVRVANNSPPRIIHPNPDQLYYAFPEDGFLNDALRLKTIFTDDDDTNLTFPVSGWTHVRCAVNEATGVVNLSADPNWFGTEVLTVFARDPTAGWARVQVYVTVQPVNDAPAFSAIPDLIVRGGPRSFSYDIGIYLTDPDNIVGDMTFNATWNDLAASVSVVGGVLYISLPKDRDVISVTIVADDGQLPSNGVTFKIGVSKTIAEMIGWPYSFPLVLLAAGVLGFFIASRLPKPHALENVFLIHNDGRLVSHVTKEENTNLDKDVVSAMFTAVQEFVRDSFQKGEVGLKKLEIGDKNVLIEKGESAYLALIYTGWPDKQTFTRLAMLLKDIEERYTGRLEHWNGTQKAVAGVENMLLEFMSDAYKPGTWHDEEKIADQEWVSILEKET
jgi:hypothetical protein